MKFILASGSERRQELLRRIVKDFDVKVSNFDEDEVIFKGDLSYKKRGSYIRKC